MREYEYNQAMLERMQQLEEAVNRAQSGRASKDDWKVIKFECGISTKRGVNHEFNSVSK
jgi:hypothetical protein